MVTDVLLSPTSYRVLEKVPAEWFDEDVTIAEIARVLELSPTRVRGSIAHLHQLRLVERRRRQTIAPSREIRKVAKE